MHPTQPCVYTAYGDSTKASAPITAGRDAIPNPRPTANSNVALSAPAATSTAWNSIGVSNSVRDSRIHRLKVSGRYWNAETSSHGTRTPSTAWTAHCNSSWL
jgi:hypothetical protein